MSTFNSGSSNTSVEYDGRIWTSFSSQGTQSTNSSFDIPYTAFQQNAQANNFVGEYNLLSNVGFGAADTRGATAANFNASRGNAYESLIADPPEMLQQRAPSTYTEPWSQYTFWQAHGTPPYPVPLSSLATGGRDRRWEGLGNIDYQEPSTLPIQTNSGVWIIAQHNSDAFSSQAAGPFISSQSGSSSGQSEKRALPPVQEQHGSRRTASPNETKGPRYACPKCPETFSRLEGVKRHDLTRHSKGPFWVCNRCERWQNKVREDKMQTHCREKHLGDFDYDVASGTKWLPYRLVDTVGDRDRACDTRTSTDEKRTRRRRDIIDDNWS